MRKVETEAIKPVDVLPAASPGRTTACGTVDLHAHDVNRCTEMAYMVGTLYPFFAGAERSKAPPVACSHTRRVVSIDAEFYGPITVCKSLWVWAVGLLRERAESRALADAVGEVAVCWFRSYGCESRRFEKKYVCT